MSKKISETRYEFQCRCCLKKTASYFSKDVWIGEWAHPKYNDEWDDDNFIYLMCAYCGSIMKMNKRFLEEKNYKTNPYSKTSSRHKSSIMHFNILVVKNFFNPPKLRNKRLRGRFR